MKKPFDFVNFDWDRKAPEEKIDWWKLPIYVLGWVGFKLLYILPFFIGFLIFGNNWKGIFTGIILFSIIFSVWAYFESRNAERGSSKS